MSPTTNPEDLPLLTDIVRADDTPLDFPMLTEIVAPAEASSTETIPERVTPEVSEHVNFEPYSIAHLASELIWNANPVAESTEAPATPDTMPAPSSIATTSSFTPEPIVEPRISEEEMQQLLTHFESRLETIFTEKLNRHFEHLHHQAVKLAISELKDELPELLKEVLKN